VLPPVGTACQAIPTGEGGRQVRGRGLECLSTDVRLPDVRRLGNQMLRRLKSGSGMLRMIVMMIHQNHGKYRTSAPLAA
jgi:hypothetical protein